MLKYTNIFVDLFPKTPIKYIKAGSFNETKWKSVGCKLLKVAYTFEFIKEKLE